MSPTGIEKVRLTLGRLLDWRRIHGLLGMRLAEMDTNKYPAGQLDTHKFSNHDWCSAPNPKDPLHNPALIMGFWRRESPDAPVIGFWWTKSPLAPGKTAPGGLRDTAARQNAAPDVAFLNLFKFWRVYKIFHRTTNWRYFSRSKSRNISLNPTLSFTALNWRVRGVK